MTRQEGVLGYPLELFMQSFQSKSQAFRRGFQEAMGAPVWVLFASMVGFGAIGKTHDVSLVWMGLTTLLVFALPGQIIMMEMMLAGVSWVTTGLVVALSSSRFITMAVTLFPQLDRKDHTPRLYATVHIMAMTAWAVCMNRFRDMAPEHRLPFFVGFGLPCWLLSVPATLLGHVAAGWVPQAFTLALVMLNPLFFLLSFAGARPLPNRAAVILGLLLGPWFFLWDADTSLLTTGLVGGTLAYFGAKAWSARAARLAADAQEPKP